MDIVGFDLSALSGWYQSRNAVRLAGLSPQPSGASAGTFNTQKSDVLAPWDVRGDITSTADIARRVLANGKFFDSTLADFSKLDAPDDHKTLFGLHTGMRGLFSLAAEAQEKTTTDTRRAFLDRRFAEGVAQLDEFLQGMDLQSLTLLKGEKLTKAESDVAIHRGVSEYTTGIVHSGEFDAEVASLTGDVQFTVSVKKSGVTTDVNIDLADMGATVRNLDNIAAHINAELDAAGVISTISRVKIGEKDENGIVQGNDFGFKISGVLTEQISFSAASGAPAVYIAGVSGIGDGAAGQIVKLTDTAAAPETGFSRRIEAASDEVETVKDDGETKTSTEANPFTISATAVSADGGVYTVGTTGSNVDGQIIKGEADLVLQKHDSTGKLVWTRTLGAAGEASGASIAVDGDGNVIVAGSVSGALGTTTALGGDDSLVVKYDSAGVEQWVQRFGGSAADRVNSVAVASDGTIYVAGEAASGFGNQAHQGGSYDGYVRAIGSDGAVQFTRRVGAAGDERASAIAVADDGGLLVASNEDGRAILRKYASGDGSSAAIWEQDLGDLDGGRIGGLAVDGTDIYLAGAAGAAFAPSAPVTANSGGRDAMLVKLSDGPASSIAYTTFLGSDADDSANGVTVSGGKVYLAGKTTGELPGATLNGSRNAFAAQLDATTGALDWATQVSGRGGLSEAAGIAVDAGGDSVLDALGLPRGAVTYSDTRVVTDRSAVRAGDHFYLSVNDGRRKKITIEAGDTMRSLTFKINAALLLDGTADVRRSTEGDRLRITPKVGTTIEFFAGAEGRDALSGLGLPAGAVTKTTSLLDKDKTSDAPPLFAMELPTVMSLTSRDRAAAAFKSLENAMTVIQRAYRDLTTPQAVKDLLEGGKGKQGGTVPAHIQAQYANYAAGLSRLQGG
ncbi:hypothetical protein [Hyphobacterium marinum]|uniref:hypothetical protein n=1 Tax=Hyphobacterium marinum TaxID=3116574 RepID=UPI002E8103F6|nr:hypothetical protein [Hyphobacterium sp. Y6023]